MNETISTSEYGINSPLSASWIDVAATKRFIGYSSPDTTSRTADAVVGLSTPKYNFSSLLLFPTARTFGPLPLSI